MNRWYHRWLRWLIRVTVLFAFRVVGKLRVEGEKNVPHVGPVVLAPNHTSAADWPAVGVACPRELRWMAKADLFDVPVIGPFCRLFHSFPVHRGTADRAALRVAEQVLNEGHALVIFPEGAVSETGELQPLKHGLALVALRTGARVVPVGISGTNRLLPYGQNLPRFVRDPVRVRFGPPIDLTDLWEPDDLGEGVPPKSAIKAATARVESALRGLVGGGEGA